jgi:hypothetical protein
MKTGLIIGGATFALLVGGVWWSQSLQGSDSEVLARGGLHWHPQLEMYVKGEKLEIPQNVGLRGIHRPVHTHEDLPLIHLEFGGVVRKEDVMLGEFFESWGKDMRSFGTSMRMMVNGVENTEYESYIMRDNDVIELQYD